MRIVDANMNLIWIFVIVALVWDSDHEYTYERLIFVESDTLTECKKISKLFPIDLMKSDKDIAVAGITTACFIYDGKLTQYSAYVYDIIRKANIRPTGEEIP